MEDPSNILLWEEDDVHAFLCGLGFKGYEAQIKEHQINGEILVQCDHEALKDVGIHSVGHRLAILKAVYQLKLQYDVPIEEGHWVPPSEFIDQVMVDSPAGVIPPDRMFELLRERDDRILSLESSISRLSEQLNGMRDEVYGLNKALYTKEPPIPINKLRPNQASPTSSGFPRAHLRNGSAHLVGSTPGASGGIGNENSPAASPMSSPVRTTHEALHSVASSSSSQSATENIATQANQSGGAGGLSYSSSIRRRVNNYFGTSTAAHHNGLLRSNEGNHNNVEQLPTSPNPATASLPAASVTEPPTPTATTYHHTSSSNNNESDQSNAVETIQSAAMTPSNRHVSGSLATDGAIQIPPPTSTTSTSTSPSLSGLQSQRPATAQAMSTSPGGTTLILPNRPSTSAETPSSSSSNNVNASGNTPSGSSAGTEKKGSSSSSSSDNPYKSFRVTMEDPCYKVLPAALKKYKINDDWRQYALFICYANTERCLAYDEKPLSLFQKLKDSNQNPVFMLRHIKDLKSPITVANLKHAARREKRLKEGKSNIIGEGREGSIREFTRATRLHHPTNLQPVKGSPNSPNPGTTPSLHHDDKDKNGSTGDKDDDGNEKGDDGSKDHHGLGYALAIYPYMADRDDEFDVNVGDTFVILNKTKGWWVVHRDTKATKESDIVRSGWVPQGCLLETAVPPSKMSSTPLSASTPINPLSIVSVSTPGLALMDYAAKGIDEITMKKGDKLRVFKRYNYWSYVIKESTGERGWTPSWFVGKFSSSSSTTTSSSIGTASGKSGAHSSNSTPTSALTTGNSSSPSNVLLHTPNSASPLSALPNSASGRKDQSLSGIGDTTPTSATMLTS